MNQVHFYFVMQTQINDYPAYLVNSQIGYIPNLLTQVSSEAEISQQAHYFLQKIVHLQGEKLECFQQKVTGCTYALVRVNLSKARRPNFQGYDWVGREFILNLISQIEGAEKDLLLSLFNPEF
jgi:hypothetical protein